MGDSQTRWARLAERRRDRKQRRAWRRDRRRGHRVDGYDAANQAESDMVTRGGFFTKK
jgi:hypothetical protein